MGKIKYKPSGVVEEHLNG